MKKYLVFVREVHVSTVAVEAENEEEAANKAEDGEGKEIECVYSHTLEKDSWYVSEDDRPNQN